MTVPERFIGYGMSDEMRYLFLNDRKIRLKFFNEHPPSDPISLDKEHTWFVQNTAQIDAEYDIYPI